MPAHVTGRDIRVSCAAACTRTLPSVHVHSSLTSKLTLTSHDVLLTWSGELGHMSSSCCSSSPATDPCCRRASRLPSTCCCCCGLSGVCKAVQLGLRLLSRSSLLQGAASMLLAAALPAVYTLPCPFAVELLCSAAFKRSFSASRCWMSCWGVCCSAAACKDVRPIAVRQYFGV